MHARGVHVDVVHIGRYVHACNMLIRGVYSSDYLHPVLHV